MVHYSPFASFSGVPYWLFGVIWFPLIFLVGLWTTRLGRRSLRLELLVLLTIGNVFTAYLWYLDIFVVESYTLLYIALYATNYALTGLVAIENWSSDIVHGYVYGTATGAVVGLLFGSLRSGGMWDCRRNVRCSEELHTAQKGITTPDSRQAEKTQVKRRLIASLKADVAKIPRTAPGVNPVTLGVGEPFTTTVTVALYFALVLSLPVILYELYGFILPALSPSERRVALPLLTAIPFLFAAGVLFGYFVVLPAAVRFLGLELLTPTSSTCSSRQASSTGSPQPCCSRWAWSSRCPLRFWRQPAPGS